ncbi:hypothetical protein COO60DRAFT_1563436 [Scenedesmus sp. NREL 46B-D3]|nr:hypothetical protein COO60DRAFT_1563436 [Scenedesmus sp. NREL 46B-D3]
MQLQSLSSHSAGCAAALGLLQHLPAHSLTHLELRMGRKVAAQLVTLCQLTALRRLNIVGTFRQWTMPAFGESHSTLVPLAALQQLTELQLPSVLNAELMQLQVPRLQQLQVRICSSAHGARKQLQLSHMTGLQGLRITDEDVRHGGLAAGDQLPPGLRELHWHEARVHWVSTAQCSAQPLLALTLLQKLYLELGRQPPEAAELAQLSSLRSLQEVALIYDSTPPGIVAAHAQAAWPVLPLVQLGFLAPSCTLELQASVVLDLGAAQGLSHVCLRAERFCTKPSELAAVLRHLPALQCLEVSEVVADGHGDGRFVPYWIAAAARGIQAVPMGRDVNAVSELLEAVGGLQELSRVHLRLAMKLASSEVQALQGQLHQLLHSELAACCTIDQKKLQLRGLHYERRVVCSLIEPRW